MPEFQAVDPAGRVWAVRHLLTATETQDLLSLDWLDLPWTLGDQQQSWARRHIDGSDPAVQRVSQYISRQLPVINSALGTEFDHCSGHFWLDLPGLVVPMHTDGELPNSMQLYWVTASCDYGTGFYLNKNGQQLMHQFESHTNTGYIMLNHANQDGSQPLLWHQMMNPVPKGTYRLSSYWYFD